jgi:sugar/nucleoside kinase (ribokinase family)
VTPDLVAVGHVTVDRVGARAQPGGAAYYAALTAHRLGLSVGLLTSFGQDFPAAELPADLAVVNAESALTTVYEVDETSAVRQLKLVARAADLDSDRLPEEWRRAPLALLCPVAGEVDPDLAARFAGSLGVVPQGWMRRRGPGGVVAPQPWDDAPIVLPHAQALVVSDEDVEPFQDDALEWFQSVPVAALTHGAKGATLYVNGEPYHVAPDPVTEVSAIGAGDVFATALLVEYYRRGDPWEAAAAAACVAAASVEAPGVAGLLDRDGLERRLDVYRRRRGG